jgi:CubicO group peptidase (beta-lactamase class C family)
MTIHIKGEKRMKKYVGAGIVLSTFMIAPSVGAQPTPSTPATPPLTLSAAQMRELDTYLDKARQDWRVPGMAVAIILDDKIVYMKGFGQRDIAKNLPVTPDTMFVGASTTKAFTSAGIAALVDEGKLTWDQPVSKYLTNFKVSDAPRSDQITLRDMLSHRTGLPRHDAIWYNNNTLTRASIVERLPFLEMSAPLRSTWQYNNIMYMTAGHVAELTAGKSWEDFTRERIFAPLGMTRTNFSVADMARDSNAATAYKLNETRQVTAIPLRNVDFIGPAGSINSTVRDYANWTRMQLNGGRFNGRQIISRLNIEATHAPLLPVGGPPEFPEFSTSMYGMGWFVDTYRGEARVQHGGNLDGFTARTTLFPGRKMGIVTFVNMEASPLPGYVSLDIVDRVLGRQPLNWSVKLLARRDVGEAATDAAKKRISEQRVANTSPAHPIAAYPGTYRNPGYGDWTFTLGDDGKMIGTYNGQIAKFSHWHYEQFDGQPIKTEDDGLENTRANFVTDLRGRVASVNIEMDPLVAPIEFKRLADPSLSNASTLAAYVGDYQLRDQVLKVTLSGTQLVLTVPGQSPYRLVPEVDGNFALESMRTIGVKFVKEGDKIVKLQMLQPNGVFDALRVAEKP